MALEIIVLALIEKTKRGTIDWKPNHMDGSWQFQSQEYTFILQSFYGQLQLNDGNTVTTLGEIPATRPLLELVKSLVPLEHPNKAKALQLASEHLTEFNTSVLTEFASGPSGIIPSDETNRLASRLYETSIENGIHPSIIIDYDGSLSFDLRLANGQPLLAFLFPDTDLYIYVYDDATDECVLNISHASENDFMKLFKGKK